MLFTVYSYNLPFVCLPNLSFYQPDRKPLSYWVVDTFRNSIEEDRKKRSGKEKIRQLMVDRIAELESVTGEQGDSPPITLDEEDDEELLEPIVIDTGMFSVKVCTMCCVGLHPHSFLVFHTCDVINMLINKSCEVSKYKHVLVLVFVLSLVAHFRLVWQEKVLPKLCFLLLLDVQDIWYVVSLL